MAKAIVFTSAFVIGLSYLTYQIIKDLDIYKELNPHSDANCVRLALPSAPEDFVTFGNFIISGIDDRDTLWGTETGAALADDGALVAIDPSSQSYSLIPLSNFPSHTAFHPHGLYLYNSLLYVINHAYRKGGERIDIFNLSLKNGSVVASYRRSVFFPDMYLGALNDLVVVNEKEMFITTWLPWPDNPDGRGIGFLETILRVLFYKLTKMTHIIHCIDENGKPNCETVDSGYLMNGIVIVKDKLIAGDAAAKKLKMFKIEGKRLKLEKELDVSCAVDNLHYDEKENVLYSGCVSRTIDYIIHMDALSTGNKTNIPSTILKVNLDNFTASEAIVTDKYSGASSAIPYGDKLVLGSWTDAGVFICSKV